VRLDQVAVECYRIRVPFPIDAANAADVVAFCRCLERAAAVSRPDVVALVLFGGPAFLEATLGRALAHAEARADAAHTSVLRSLCGLVCTLLCLQDAVVTELLLTDALFEAVLGALEYLHLPAQLPFPPQVNMLPGGVQSAKVSTLSPFAFGADGGVDAVPDPLLFCAAGVAPLAPRTCRPFRLLVRERLRFRGHAPLRRLLPAALPEATPPEGQAADSTASGEGAVDDADTLDDETFLRRCMALDDAGRGWQPATAEEDDEEGDGEAEGDGAGEDASGSDAGVETPAAESTSGDSPPSASSTSSLRARSRARTQQAISGTDMEDSEAEAYRAGPASPSADESEWASWGFESSHGQGAGGGHSTMDYLHGSHSGDSTGFDFAFDDLFGTDHSHLGLGLGLDMAGRDAPGSFSSMSPPSPRTLAAARAAAARARVEERLEFQSKLHLGWRADFLRNTVLPRHFNEAALSVLAQLSFTAASVVLRIVQSSEMWGVIIHDLYVLDFHCLCLRRFIPALLTNIVLVNNDAFFFSVHAGLHTFRNGKQAVSATRRGNSGCAPFGKCGFRIRRHEQLLLRYQPMHLPMVRGGHSSGTTRMAPSLRRCWRPSAVCWRATQGPSAARVTRGWALCQLLRARRQCVSCPTLLPSRRHGIPTSVCHCCGRSSTHTGRTASSTPSYHYFETRTRPNERSAPPSTSSAPLRPLTPRG
jgi:hypothetical protein